MKKYVLCGATAIAALAMGCADALPEPRVSTNGTTSAETPSKLARRFGEFAPVASIPVASAPNDPSSDVRVLEGDDMKCESEVVGVVEADDVDRAHAVETLRTRAGALGAEALTAMTSRGTHYTAAAVRCRDLRQGRAYEVIETIAIPVESQDETSAFDALLARAYDLHADLIIDIDRSADRITGTAIRYK